MEINVQKNDFGIYVIPQMQNEELTNAAMLFSGEVLKYLEGYKNDVGLIDLDPYLSEEGKKAKIDKLKPNHVRAMDDFARRAVNLQEHYKPDVVKARTAKTYVSKDPLRDSILAVECRSLLRAQGDVAIRTAYLNPQLDGFVRWAIDSSYVPMISDPEILRRGRDGFIGEENTKFIADVQEFMNILQDVIGKACTYLKIHTPVGIAGLTKI